MNCPSCGGKTGVFDTKENEEGDLILRRRKCKSCGYTFPTIEIDRDWFEMLTDVRMKIKHNRERQEETK